MKMKKREVESRGPETRIAPQLKITAQKSRKEKKTKHSCKTERNVVGTAGIA